MGYAPVDIRKEGRLPIGTVALDAVFSPIQNVNFHVENMRVGDRTDYNRVNIEVETDGTISPSSAMHKAASVLLDHFGKLESLEVVETERPEEPAPKKTSTAKKPSKMSTTGKKAKKPTAKKK